MLLMLALFCLAYSIYKGNSSFPVLTHPTHPIELLCIKAVIKATVSDVVYRRRSSLSWKAQGFWHASGTLYSINTNDHIWNTYTGSTGEWQSGSHHQTPLLKASMHASCSLSVTRRCYSTYCKHNEYSYQPCSMYSLYRSASRLGLLCSLWKERCFIGTRQYMNPHLQILM